MKAMGFLIFFLLTLLLIPFSSFSRDVGAASVLTPSTLMGKKKYFVTEESGSGGACNGGLIYRYFLKRSADVYIEREWC